MQKRTKIIILIIVAILAAFPVYITSNFIYYEIIYLHINETMYPDWDFFCWSYITVTNFTTYDKEFLIEITETAIRDNYPDVNMKEHIMWVNVERGQLVLPILTSSAIGIDNDFSMISTEYSYKLHLPAPIVLKALYENNIQVERVSASCA